MPRVSQRRDRGTHCVGSSAAASMRVEVDDAAIVVHFAGGAEMEIPVSIRRDAEWAGPEWAHFVPGPNQPVQVW